MGDLRGRTRVGVEADLPIFWAGGLGLIAHSLECLGMWGGPTGLTSGGNPTELKSRDVCMEEKVEERDFRKVLIAAGSRIPARSS